MIIIKTQDGDVMVNEKAIRTVTQKKNERLAFIISTHGSETIKDVDSVLYFSDAAAIQYKDEGSEVASLQQRCNEREVYIEQLKKELKAVKDDLLHFAFNMEQIVCHYHEQIPSDICKLIKTPALELKSKVLNDKYK